MAGCASARRSASGPDALERAQALVAAGADVLVVDTAHGHSRGVIEMVARIRALSGEFEVVAGNIATGEAAEALIDAGADAVKAGIGPGLFLHDPDRRRRRRAADHGRLRRRRGRAAPRRAGHRRRRDLVVRRRRQGDRRGRRQRHARLVCSPAPTRLRATSSSRTGERYKEYRGMGSIGAMKARGYSKDRYFQGDVEDVEKLVPEGIEGRVPYKGPLSGVVHQIVGGVRQAMGYCGAPTIDAMKRRALRAHHRRRPARVAPARHHDHQGRPELSPRLRSSRSRPGAACRRSGRCWCSTSAASTRS